MRKVTVTIAKFVIGSSLALVLLTLVGCDRDHTRYVIDCREAGSKFAANYDKTDWQTQEFHYNTDDGHCYARLDAQRADTLDEGQRVYTRTEAIFDVDENREVIGCTLTRNRGALKENRVCAYPDRSTIPTYADFLKERAHLLQWDNTAK